MGGGWGYGKGDMYRFSYLDHSNVCDALKKCY